MPAYNSPMPTCSLVPRPGTIQVLITYSLHTYCKRSNWRRERPGNKAISNLYQYRHLEYRFMHISKAHPDSCNNVYPNIACWSLPWTIPLQRTCTSLTQQSSMHLTSTQTSAVQDVTTNFWKAIINFTSS